MTPVDGGGFLGPIAAWLGGRPRVAIAGSFAIAYLSFAWIVGRSYPINRMRMFAPADTSASHVVARTEDGRLREVRWFARWSCDGELDFGTSVGGTRRGGDEIVRLHVLRNAGEPLAAVPVELVRATFSIPTPHGPVEETFEPLARCRADLRDEAASW